MAATAVGFIFLLCSVASLLGAAAAAAETQSYVVYLGEHAGVAAATATAADKEALARRAEDSHYELLAGVLGDKEKAREAIFYSYTRHINGFAANLDAAAAAEIAGRKGVVSVFPNRGHKLHTTRSWQFLGLAGPGGVPTSAAWRKARFGEDTIIGNLDTGVWPESESFRDDGLGPVPSQWKGECQKGQDDTFSCNRKLIGARFFNKGYASAVGNGGNLFGYGNGTAKGGAPGAHVAAYKVCWRPVNGSECFDADILAAFEAAISDGVHVLSVSLGGDPGDLFPDRRSFHAARRGIAVVCSAGNSGPAPGTVSNVAPWIFTAAASTMDREFPSYLVFNSTRIKGQSLSASALSPAASAYAMIDSSRAAAPNRTQNESRLCMLGSLDPAKVKGKIVVCLRGVNPRVEKGEAVREAGGAGMVLANDATTGNEIIADAHVLPATHVKFSDGQRIFSYLKKTKNPSGTITRPETRLGAKPAPFMASFSSKGPNTVTPGILKPDITAPGVSVVAAWTRANSPTDLAFDKRRVAFNSESGTSMSCPHVAGIVGLLRTLRPDWSPAAIRSALMTTATDVDNDRHPILNSSSVAASPFNYDAGHPYKCPASPPKAQDLNYPSITVVNLTSSATVKRTVKNVGTPGTYKAYVNSPAGVRVAVSPDTLAFATKGEEKTFRVSFQVTNAALAMDYAFGALVWTNGKQFVRSPLVVKTTA
uniref:Subtilisin-like protease n=1 Tax=Oryza brachyantha TaxID=4533 RepID=J3LAL5_ORYBR